MPQTRMEQTKILLIRYIRDQHLKRGDRLPGQVALRKLFDCGSATVLNAIHELKDDGVLEIRDKVGVFVSDPFGQGHAGRTIGICSIYVDESAYYSCMLSTLQLLLAQEGCRGRIFCSAVRQGASDSFQYDFEEFPGLRRAVENEEIQGLIHLDDLTAPTLRLLREREIPTLFCGAYGSSPNGLFLNHPEYLARMYKAAAEAGKKRVALLIHQALQRYLEPVFLALGGAPSRVFMAQNIADAQALGEQFAAQPASSRPDALLCFDDIIAQWIYGTMVRRLPQSELPFAYVLYNRQLQLCFPLENAFPFEIDLHAFARQTIQLLLQSMREHKTDIGPFYYNNLGGK